MTTETIHTDICIVGAGPGGATAALFLGKMGIPHLILDAATFPRDKVCGDGLDLKVFRVLHHLDPQITEKDVFEDQEWVQSWGARFIGPNGRKNDYTYKPKPDEPNYPLFWVSKRLHFDNFLVKRFNPQYTDFRQGTAAKEVLRDGKGWIVRAKTGDKEIEIRCKLVIGADGEHSVVLRGLGERKIDRQHYAAAQRQYWRGIEGFHEYNLIEVYFPKSMPWSYFWMFPLPNGEANVGFGMVSEIAAEHKLKIRDEFKRIMTEDPHIAPRFKNATPLEEPIGWGLPLASKKRKTFGDGYLLLGDAASLICPTSGEGIGTAMMSGYVAAQFVQKAVGEKRFDEAVFTNFDREVYRRLHSEIFQYNYGRKYMPWWMMEQFLNIVGPSRPLLNYYRRHVGGWLNTAFHKPIAVDV